MKEEGLIIEETSEIDRRVKKLYSTDKGDALIRKLNKAQDDLFHRTKQKVGNDWYAIMEELANYREGFKTIEHLKKTRKAETKCVMCSLQSRHLREHNEASQLLL